MLTKYERIGETARWETLPNGLPVCIVPKKGFQRKYALFATRYGGMVGWTVAGYACRYCPLSGA